MTAYTLHHPESSRGYQAVPIDASGYLRWASSFSRHPAAGHTDPRRWDSLPRRVSPAPEVFMRAFGWFLVGGLLLGCTGLLGETEEAPEPGRPGNGGDADADTDSDSDSDRSDNYW